MGSFVKRERRRRQWRWHGDSPTPPSLSIGKRRRQVGLSNYLVLWVSVCKKCFIKKGARLFIRGNRNYNAKRIPPHATHRHRAQSCGEDYFHRRRGHGENACLNRWRWVQEWKVLCRGWFLRSSRRGRRICMQSASSAVISAKCLFSPHHTSFKIWLIISYNKWAWCREEN